MAAIKTKLQFVTDMIRNNPDDTRERIISKIARNRVEYRGKKFTKRTASRYYWYIMKTKFNERKIVNTLKVPTGKNNKLTITFPEGMSNKQKLTYVLNIMTSSGIIN